VPTIRGLEVPVIHGQRNNKTGEGSVPIQAGDQYDSPLESRGPREALTPVLRERLGQTPPV
jgi:hypothetical protein